MWPRTASVTAGDSGGGAYCLVRLSGEADITTSETLGGLLAAEVADATGLHGRGVERAHRAQCGLLATVLEMHPAASLSATAPMTAGPSVNPKSRSIFVVALAMPARCGGMVLTATAVTEVTDKGEPDPGQHEWGDDRHQGDVRRGFRGSPGFRTPT